MNHFKCKLAPSNLLRKGMKMIDFGGWSEVKFMGHENPFGDTLSDEF